MAYMTCKASPAQAAGIIRSIEASAKRVKNVTDSYPASSIWISKSPVSLKPLGKKVVIDKLEVLSGRFPLSFLRQPPVFFERILSHLSAYAAVSFDVDLNPKRSALPDLRTRLELELGKFIWHISGYRGFYSGRPFEELDALREVLTLADFPVAVEEKKGRFRFRSTEKGIKLEIPDESPGERDIPESIGVIGPSPTFPEALDRFLSFVGSAAFSPQASDFEWIVNVPGKELGFKEIEPSSFLKLFNSFRFPGKTVEVVFDWHLKHYNDLPELLKLSKLKMQHLDAHLLEFQIKPGLNCRVVCECISQNVIKFWFNVPSDNDLPILKSSVKQLGIKAFANTWL
jgi:hypothetical protein